jgi:hypothetical protein
MATSKKPTGYNQGATKKTAGTGGGAAAGPSFAATVKPYFTECYRSHMNSTDYVGSPFDLWSAADVKRKWTSIKNAVQNGYMPPPADEGCEGAWSDAQKAKFLKDFQAWKDGGYQP